MAHETQITISQLRRHPSRYLGTEPVSVHKHNQVIGYAMGPELFEELVKILGQSRDGSELLGKWGDKR